jgi:thiosulfate dehydrogenase [quinone] large subunit
VIDLFQVVSSPGGSKRNDKQTKTTIFEGSIKAMRGIASTIKTVFTKAEYTGLFWLVLRVFVGYEFLSAGIDKVASGKWLGQNAIGGFMKGALTKAATGEHPEVQSWYVDLINGVFLPNAALFSTLVALGEVLVGLALLFGIFTKFAAVNGAIMNIAFLAAGTSSSNPQMLVMQVAMVFGGVGVAYYGIDYFLMPLLKKALHIGQPEAEREAVSTRVSLPKARPVS